MLRDARWHDPKATAHEILGVDARASPEIIRRTYVRLIRLCHPDHFSDSPQFQQQAELATKRINEAYEMLSRPSHSRTGAAFREQRRRLYQNVAHRQLAAADKDILFDEQTRIQRVIVVVLTLSVCAASLLFLVLLMAAWFGMSR